MKKVVDHIAIMVLMALLTNTGLSQFGLIRGVVTDSVTGLRLAYANVMVLNSTRGSSANGVGFYLIANVPLGTQEIAASVVGYERQILRVVVRQGEASQCNFRLAPGVISSEEIVVTGQSKREISQISTSIHMLEPRDIKMAPVALQEDVFQAFRILPGIVSTSDVGSKFYVRGGAGDQNLFLLDGMRIYTPFHALGLFSVIDPDIIHDAEIYTGAFPAGLGGRLSSVVSLSTRDGRGDRLSARTSVNFLSGKMLLEGPGPFGATWLINVRKSISPQTIKRVLRQDFPVSFYDGFIKVSSSSQEIHKYDLTVLSTADNLLSGVQTDPDYHWRTNAIAISGSGLLAETVFIEAVVYANKSSANRVPQLGSTITPSSTSVSEHGLRGSATMYTSQKDLFFFGFEFGFPTLDYKLTNNLGVPLDIKSTVVELSIWFRYQAKLDPWLIDAGVHTEVGTLVRRGVTGSIVQPRLNMSYLMFGNWRAKASYGRFSQDVMTVSNEDDVISIFEGWIEVPKYLPPQQSDHYVLGTDGNLTEDISLSLQTYYKYYPSLVAYNRRKVDAFDVDYISGNGESYGAEAMVRSRFSMVDFYASYALSWAKISNSGMTYYPRYDRRHQLNALAVAHLLEWMDITVRWEVGSGFPFTQSSGYFDRLTLKGALPGPFEYETGQPYNVLGEKNVSRLPDYHRLDVGVVARFSLSTIKGTLGLQVVNAYDQRNIFYFDRSSGRRINMVPFFPSANLTLEY